MFFEFSLKFLDITGVGVSLDMHSVEGVSSLMFGFVSALFKIILFFGKVKVLVGDWVLTVDGVLILFQNKWLYGRI